MCLCLVVRNEAPFIRACLESLRRPIDAWIVVDRRSKDGTQNIVRRALADLPGPHAGSPTTVSIASSEAAAIAISCPARDDRWEIMQP